MNITRYESETDNENYKLMLTLEFDDSDSFKFKIVKLDHKNNESRIVSVRFPAKDCYVFARKDFCSFDKDERNSISFASLSINEKDMLFIENFYTKAHTEYLQKKHKMLNKFARKFLNHKVGKAFFYTIVGGILFWIVVTLVTLTTTSGGSNTGNLSEGINKNPTNSHQSNYNDNKSSFLGDASPKKSEDSLWEPKD